MTTNSPADPARSTDVQRVIDRIVRERTTVASSDGTTHPIFPVAINPAEGEALRDWVTREDAKQTIEVGLGYAISALFICDGLLNRPGFDGGLV